MNKLLNPTNYFYFENKPGHYCRASHICSSYSEPAVTGTGQRPLYHNGLCSPNEVSENFNLYPLLYDPEVSQVQTVFWMFMFLGTRLIPSWQSSMKITEYFDCIWKYKLKTQHPPKHTKKFQLLFEYYFFIDVKIFITNCICVFKKFWIQKSITEF